MRGLQLVIFQDQQISRSSLNLPSSDLRLKAQPSEMDINDPNSGGVFFLIL